MAGRVRVKHHIDGYKALRSSRGVVADLEARAARVQRAAGDGYEVSSQQGAARPQGRWRTTVVTATRKAMLDNQRHNTLLKALGSSGG